MNKEQFLSDLQDLCEKHGVAIEGVCKSEGIDGEISVIKDDGQVFHLYHFQDAKAEFDSDGDIVGTIRSKEFQDRFQKDLT